MAGLAVRDWVSIHAPREGRDDIGAEKITVSLNVSIHAPREGRDSSVQVGSQPIIGFNPRAP